MKIEYRRINHVTLAVPAGEHEKVRAFYCSVLGLKDVERPDALKKVYDCGEGVDGRYRQPESDPHGRRRYQQNAVSK